MNIIVTNDDGYNQKGIICLAKALAKEHNVTVIAPETEQSAVSHGITMRTPLFVRKKELYGLENTDVYAVTGSPADCVKFALCNMRGELKPDIVVSGINAGSNLGGDIFYSGTVSAAVEAALGGIKSIAFSLNVKQKSDFMYFEEASTICAKLVNMLSNADFDVLNINIPAKDNLKNCEAVCVMQGKAQFKEKYERNISARMGEYYWLEGEYIGGEEKESTDGKALNEGKITITPIKINLTDFDKIFRIENILNKNSCKK